MMGWSIAAILYALPILSGIRNFDAVVENCRDWMRSDEGDWYPQLAPLMAAINLILWPLDHAIAAISPKEPEDRQ
jgi:hypothetical protein